MFYKILYNIISKYQDVKYSIFYQSPWGRAIAHAAWHQYKQTVIYSERVKYFGRIEAAKMFTVSEFRWFKYKCYKDETFFNTWLYNPWSVLQKFEEEDSFLKPLLFQEDN